MENKPLDAGTTLKGRYRIVRLVAGGGMAWVYEVEETHPDGGRRTWAMKELRADGDDTHTLEEGRRLFEQEANILVRLDHPNLPRVSAFFEERGRVYLVMEFIQGCSLEKRLEQANAPILEGQVVDWAIQICEVLTYLHTRPQPIIFRDLKPSNVMVTPEGRVKLIDFGIARTYKLGKRKDTITMGSENYAAPEQWGKAQTDARADIYSLGATMYHLLANVPPLPTFVPTPRVPIGQYNPAVTERTVAFVDKCMATDREQRYASAEEARQELLAGLPRHERQRIEARAQRAPVPSATPVPTPAMAPPVTALPATAATHAPARPTTIGAAPSMGQPAHAAKRCPGCSQLNRADARFCRACGQPLVPTLPPVLALVMPQGARWEYPLRGAQVLLGRPGGQHPVDLDISFYDPEGFVSRNHARLEEIQRRYQIVDLGSANGTFVNGERLVPHAPRPLRNGDRLRFGRVVLQFRLR